MTVEELIISFGFDAKDALSVMDRVQNKLKEFEQQAKDIQINADTSKLQRNLVKIVSVAGKTSRALEQIGRSAVSGITKAIKLSANLSASLLKIGAGTVAGAIAGSGAIASSVAEKATLARSFGTDLNTIKAISKGLKDVSTDAIIDQFEEMRNKVQLSITSLQRDLKAGKASIEEFNLAGYTDSKGKKKDAKRIEEGTLNDLFATTLGNGDLGKVDKDFKGILNTAKALQIFSKKSANEQFTIMAKLVDISEDYISNMDDWLGGEAQKIFSQLRAEAQRTGVTIEQLLAKRKDSFFINKEDIDDLIIYDKSLRDLGSTLKEISQKASAGLGGAISPYINQINQYIQDHKQQINEFVDFAKGKLKSFFESVKTWGSENLFDNGQFVGYEEAISRVIDAVKAKLVELKTALYEALQNNEFGQKIIEISGYIEKFAYVIAGATILNAIATFAGALSALALPGGAILLVIGAITSLVALFANWDTVTAWAEGVKESIGSAMDSVAQKVTSAVDGIKKKLAELWDSLKNSTLGKGVADLWNKTKSAFSSFTRSGNNGTPTQPTAEGNYTKPTYSTPTIPTSAVTNAKTTNVNSNVSNNITVNVTKTNASPNDIASEVSKVLETDAMKRNTTVLSKVPNAG